VSLVMSGRADGRHQEEVKLAWWEVVGAWLRIWTPPRGARVPPVPRAKLAIALVAVVAVIGGAVALLAPGINRAKENRAREAARALAQARAAERRRLKRLEVARFGRSDRRRPAGISAPGERRLRHAVLADLERAITGDARTRARRGQIQGRIRATSCDPFPPTVSNVGPETTLKGTIGKYACTAIEDYIPNGSGGRGALGYPFWAKVNFRTLRFAWCEISPRAGERLVGQDLAVVPPPKACDLGY
jgi:type II secretory pathway pseudopilin PulG